MKVILIITILILCPYLYAQSVTDNNANCQKWAANGNCTKINIIQCKKSCGATQNTTQNQSNAEVCDTDKNANCQSWAAVGECSINPAYMNVECKKSCNVDKHAQCQSWTQSGECSKNPAYMLSNCRKSCMQYCTKDEFVFIPLYDIASNNRIVVTRKHLRLAYIDPKQITDKIINIIESLLASFTGCPSCLKQLEAEKPVYLIGDSARNFSEFDAFKNTATTDGGRTLLDIDAFGTNSPYAGFISTKFLGCHQGYSSESIIVHEFLHTIHISSFNQTLKTELKSLYDRYKVTNPYYSIQSYAFLDDREFFAVLGTVYLGVQTRLDDGCTGKISYTVLTQKLPLMFAFLQKLFPEATQNKTKTMICGTKCNETFCRK